MMSEDMPQQKDPQLITEAEALPIATRKAILAKMKETELHSYLEELFSRIDSNSEVIITHGTNEYGKDLVIIKRDPLSTTARAVIAKCGNVTGNANGPIDDIKSQVGMAFDMPYKSSGLESIPVVEALVVINGNLSRNAIERIENQFNQYRITFIDSEKLVALFTEYFPRVFFGGLEYDYLDKKICELDQDHLFGDQGLTLTQSFVDPTIKKIDVTTNNNNRFSSKEKRMHTKEFTEIASRLKKAILVGDAGCGKSTFLKKMAIDSMRKVKADYGGSPTISIPVYIEARRIPMDHGNDLLEEIRNELDFPLSLNIEALYIDGLDEITPEERTLVLASLEDAIKANGINMVVTSRCRDHFDALDWPMYEIAPMNTSQALSLCEKTINDPEIVVTLKDGINEMQKNFALTPLSVFLLAEIVKVNNEVPASLTELYDQYVDGVLGKFDKEKGIESLFEYEMKKRFLGDLSQLQYIENDLDEISVEEFESFGHSFFEQYEWPWDNWDKLLEELKRSCLIEINQETSTIRFRHRTFLEFFAAYALHVDPGDEEDPVDRAITLYFSPLWTDVAFYYFGLKKSITKSALRKIFSWDDDSAFALVSKMQSGRLLQAGWHCKAEVKQYGLINASEYAPQVYRSFARYIKEEDAGVPPFIGDLIVFSIACDSYGSLFLRKQIEDILSQPIMADEDGLISRLCLFVAVSPKLSKEKRNMCCETFLGLFDSLNDKALEGRGLMLLSLGTCEDKATGKLINRKIKSFAKRHPSIIKGMLS